MGQALHMDGKLDPSFNTGAELRKLLRDPRQLEVGRAHGFRRASSPKGLLTKALRIALLASFCAIAALVALQAARIDVEGSAESVAWLWLGVWVGVGSGLIFLIARLRAMLAPRGNAAEVERSTGKDPGREDWFTEDIAFFTRAFVISALGGLLLAVGAVALVLEFLPDSIASDRVLANVIARGGGAAMAILFGHIIWRALERRHERLAD